MSQLVLSAPQPPPVDDEQLLEVLKPTLPLIVEFAKLIQTMSAMNDVDAVVTTFKALSPIVSRCQLQSTGVGGTYHQSDFDFFRFLAHELVVTLVVPLLKEDRFDAIRKVFDTEVELNPRPALTSEKFATFGDFSGYVHLL